MNLQVIQSKIYEIRGQKVMLDRDLAEMYGVLTKALNQAVKRNIDRFPDDFMFQLTKEECLRSQIVTLNTEQGKHLKYMPYVFTEMGVAMLSSVLRSSTAIQVNINIMRAFVAVRQMILSPKTKTDKVAELEKRMDAIENYIEEVFTDYNDIHDDTRIQLELINQALAGLQAKDREFKERKRIGYKLPGCEDDMISITRK